MPTKLEKCIFCGGSPLSREHIWSQWTYDQFPKQPDTYHVRGLHKTSPRNRNMRSVEKLKKHSGACNSIKIKAVCQDCNNGWMSRLENAAKPILSDLMQVKPHLLDEDKQRIVGAWIAMKMMVIEFALEDAVASQGQREFVMVNQEPPGEWRIWIAAHSSIEWTSGMSGQAVNVGLVQDGKTIPPKSEWQRVRYFVVGVGRLLAIGLFGSKEIVPLQFPDRHLIALRQIQPFYSDVRWVPLVTLDHPQIVELVVPAFDRFTKRLTWMPDEEPPQAAGGPA